MAKRTVFYFYTNILAPYMFHRWKMISQAYPGSLVIVTRRADLERPWKYKPEDMDFPCIAATETIRISNHFAWSKGLKQIVKKSSKQNVIHLLEDVSGINVLTIMNASKGDSYIIANDGGFPETTRRFSQKLRWNLVGKRCAGAITPGIYGKKYMEAWGFPDEKIFNSYLSHDVQNFSSYRDSELAASERIDIRNELGLNENDLLVLCNSRLLDWKRIEDLADSLQFLSDKAKNRIFLLLIGDGPYKKPLESLQINKQVRFKWIPATSYENVKKFYAASDLFVLPSEGDIWGLVINEALSMGKPVICTNRIGASCLIKNDWNGFTIGIRNPEALAASIEKLVLDDKLRQLMSSNAMNIEKTWHSGLLINELEKIAEKIYP